MGLLDQLRQGFQYKQAPGQPAALANTTVPATRIVGGAAGVGGQVSVTNDALVFEPVDTDAARRLLVAAGRVGLLPGAGVANRVLDQTGLLEPNVISLDRIQSVEPYEPAGLVPRLFSPPGVQLNLDDGTSMKLGVLNDPLSSNVSRKNRPRRDEFAEALNALLASR